MSMIKFLVNCYSAMIWNREKRHAVRDVLLTPLPNPNETFVPVGGFLDHGEIDWGTYMLTHDMREKVSALRQGLDDASNRLLDLIFSRMTIFPRGHYRLPWNYKIRETYLRSFFYTPEELDGEKTYWAELPQYNTEFPMDAPEYNPDVFLYHCGLKNKNEKLKKYINGKDFVDGGAYIGDSALFYIKRYAPRCVYSFEISKKTCMRYENTMRINSISADRYKLCRMGLSDKKSEILMHDSGGQGTSILDQGNDMVQVTDLDSFVIENNLHVGFVKCDLEGAGLEGTLGMAETIKRDRPVLNIAIYHNPKEFFEIKPALEKITVGLDYKITIERHHPLNDRMVEVVVFAYPKELE